MFLLSHWAFDRRAQWVKITFDLILIRERSVSIALSIFNRALYHILNYFCLVYEYHPKSRIDPSGNTGCQKIDKMDHFWHLSRTSQNVNVARFARNV